MMDTEEIDDDSSQENHVRATVGPKKKKSRKDKHALVPPANTLTRFLGPSGSTSSPDWEDVNRQCPVCQQRGFSSRALALHVNECLDVGLAGGGGSDGGRAGAEHEAGTSGDVRAANASTASHGNGGSRTPASAARKVGKLARRSLSAGRMGGRKGDTVEPRNAPQERVGMSNEGEQQPYSQKTVTKAKKHHSSKSVTERSGSGATKTGISKSKHRIHGETNGKSGARALQPRSITPAQPQPPSTGATQPAPSRRRGLLSRPRGQDMAGDPTPTSSAPVKASHKESAERARDHTAHAQVLLVPEIPGGAAARSVGWIGTQLFPRPAPEENSSAGIGCCVARDCEGDGEDACKSRSPRTRNRRVRPRPASWGVGRQDENQTWLGIRPDSINDDFWGDGDGYLTLRPFPSREELAELDAPSDDGEGGEPRAGGVGTVSSRDVDPAPISRAARFLEVFSRLQPARRALKLGVPSSSSAVSDKRPKKSGQNPLCGDSRGVIAAVASSAPHQQAEPLAGAVAATPVAVRVKSSAGDGASSHEDRRVAELKTPIPKRRKTGMGASIASSDDKTQGVNASVDKEDGNLKDALPEKRRRSPPAQRSVAPGHAYSNEEAPKRKLGRESPGRAPQNVKRPVQRPVEARPNYQGEGQTKDAPDMIDITSDSPSPPTRARPKDGGVSGIHIERTCALDAPPRALEAGKAAVKENLRPKGANLSVASEQAPRRLSEAVPHAKAPALAPRDRSAVAHISAATASTARRLPTSHGAENRTLPRDGSAVASRGARSALSRERGGLRGNNGMASNLAEKKGGYKEADAKRDTESVSASASQQRSFRPKGIITPRASSGLLRSADFRAEAGNAESGNLKATTAPPCESGAAGGREASKTPAVSAMNGTAQLGCQGEQADVPQKGSLTVVDPDHGATLRSSWSIDHSEELGKLEFGVSLGYDAVWFYPPVDADCVGVLRYHVVPDPVLAPLGGWISEKGRLQDDPYIIAKATPTDPSSLARTSVSHQRRGSSQGASRLTGADEIRPTRCSQQSSQSRPRNARVDSRPVSKRRAQGPGGSRQTPTVSTYADTVQRRNPNAVEHSRARHEKPRSQGRPAGATVSVVSPKTSPARGRFGLATSPSAQALEASDTGDRVKCPVCHRGMDHWQPAQRNQHVHGCMLKQPSSADKLQPAAVATRDTAVTAVRVAGTARRLQDVSRGAEGFGQPTPPRGSQIPQRRESARDGGGQSGSYGRGQGLPDPTGGARAATVSLQGVFSPKPTRGPDPPGRGQLEHVHHRDGPPSRRAAPSTVPQGTSATKGIKPRPGVAGNQGMRSTGSSASKGPSECPICNLSFVGRMGGWESGAHIKQCLESLSLAGAFDSCE